MGEIAESMISGECDYLTGEYLGSPCGYPRTSGNEHSNRYKPVYLKVKAIRRELAILIQERQASCSTDTERNSALNQARKEMNEKYGRGWRELTHWLENGKIKQALL